MVSKVSEKKATLGKEVEVKKQYLVILIGALFGGCEVEHAVSPGYLKHDAARWDTDFPRYDAFLPEVLNDTGRITVTDSAIEVDEDSGTVTNLDAGEVASDAASHPNNDAGGQSNDSQVAPSDGGPASDILVASDVRQADALQPVDATSPIDAQLQSDTGSQTDDSAISDSGLQDTGNAVDGNSADANAFCDPTMALTCESNVMSWCGSDCRKHKHNCGAIRMRCGTSELISLGCLETDSGSALPVLDSGINYAVDAGESCSHSPDAGFTPFTTTYKVECYHLVGDPARSACTFTGVLNAGAWMNGFNGKPIRIVAGSVRSDGSEPICRESGGTRYECRSMAYAGSQQSYTTMLNSHNFIRFGVTTVATYGPGGAKENSAVDPIDVAAFNDPYRAEIVGDLEFQWHGDRYELYLR